MLLVVVLAFSIVNRNGEFYPDNDTENFALIERSGAYRELLELQRMGVKALTEAAESAARLLRATRSLPTPLPIDGLR